MRALRSFLTIGDETMLVQSPANSPLTPDKGSQILGQLFNANAYREQSTALLLTNSVRTRIVHFMKTVCARALGARLRTLRTERKETLREVAASAVMDPALLSKIERGSRLPTSEQITGLSRHLGISEDDLQAQRIAADFLAHYGESHFASQAITVIQEALRRDRPSGK